MTDFDSIWRTQDEIRTVVNAGLGEYIWNLNYNERRMAIELELTKYLEEEEVDMRTLRTSSYRLPNHRTIEVGESHILVELPAVQNIAEICVMAIPPDAEYITVSVQAHQVVEIHLIDCLIL